MILKRCERQSKHSLRLAFITLLNERKEYQMKAIREERGKRRERERERERERKRKREREEEEKDFEKSCAY